MAAGGFDACPVGRCVEKGSSDWQKVEAIWQCPACGHQISTSPSFCGVVDCSCGAGKIMELLSMTVDGVTYDGNRP